MDQISVALKQHLDKRKMDDLEIALILGKNEGLINALENDDEDLGYIILKDITTTIEKNTNRYIRAQVITKELNVFCRSWDDIYAGMPLWDYRLDLKYFQTHNTPRTSIEIGRRLGIKSTVPMYKDGVFIGFVEVISFFESITDFFRSMGLEMYALLDLDYSDTAVLMMQNLVVQNSLMANRNYNHNHIKTLQKIDMKDLKLNGVSYMDRKYIFYEKMYDGRSTPIGAFLFVLPERYLDYFRSEEDEISFFINMTKSDLYNVVQRNKYYDNEKNNYSIYGDFSAESMVYLQDTVDEKDKQEFLDEAYAKFDQFTKDELIQMILNQKVIKKIDGEIR